MTQLIEQLKNLVYFVTLHPGSNEELLVRLLLGVLTAAGILNLSAHLFRMSFPSFSAAFLIMVVSGMILFTMAAFGHIYFIRLKYFEGMSPEEFTVAVFVFFSILLVIPLIRSTWCGNFFNATLSWVAAVVVFILTCVAIGEIFQATETGREFASGQKRKLQSHDQLLKQEIQRFRDRAKK